MTVRHYSPPPIEDASPPTKRVLLHLLEVKGESPELYAALGTLALRDSFYAEAKEHLKRALELNPELSKMRTNLGVVHVSLSEMADAEVQFREALLHDPSLEIATLELVELLLSRGEHEQSLRMIERILQTKNRKSLAELNYKAGVCADALEQKERARKYFEQAALEKLDEALMWLANDDVDRARSEIREGNVINAGRILSKAYQREPMLFSGSAGAVTLLNELRLMTIPEDSTQGVTPLYLFLLQEFLKLGIGWEVFEEYGELEKALELWKERIKKRSSYPYGQYRVGIILAFLGSYMESFDALDLCKSQLPAKKQMLLKLDRVMSTIEAARAKFEYV